ncbi:hypothetical protein [Aquisalibacillus elongatus]|uniref:ABC-2 family transporter n=1 Tax=Aquisalibacillus elongatus TaxID=485577 RepID=A0A3N5B4N3_9BACI|nr:hypothetical protein [Aquisalibacillus elongatus]RPF52237.1 hypothetical protein EDC24_2230 [Aquisalibacillus elongatus]
MIRSLIKHEFKLTLTSKKNLLFASLLGILLIIYAFVLIDHDTHPESFDPEAKQFELNEIEAQQETRRQTGNTGIGGMSGPVHNNMAYYINTHQKQMRAFENDNFRRYTVHRLDYLTTSGRTEYVGGDLFMESPIPGKDQQHLYDKTLLRLQSYLNQDHTINYSMLTENTALQQLQKLLSNSFVYIIIFIFIFISSDALTRDKHHKTLLQGFPTSWYLMLNVKSFISYAYALLLTLGLIGLGLVLISSLYGFGHLDMQIPIKVNFEMLGIEHYEMISISELLLKSSILLIIITLIFNRLNMWLSLVSRNVGIVLFVSTFFLISEIIYSSRTTRELFGIELQYFPQTYFDVGQSITFEKNFLINVDNINFQQGITVLLITLFIIEILFFLTSKWITRQKFFQT